MCVRGRGGGAHNYQTLVLGTGILLGIVPEYVDLEKGFRRVFASNRGNWPLFEVS